jgi:hypothetical protein
MLSEGHGVVHYGSKHFAYDGKEKSEFVQWTEKNIDKEITMYLQRHLLSKSIQPCDVKHVQMVVGGDHGNTIFQFGALVLVELADNCNINFEVSVCKLICRKDTGRLLEETILVRLSSGLEIIATFNYIYLRMRVALSLPSFVPTAKFRTQPQQTTHPSPKSLSRATWHSKPWHWGKS